MEIAVKTDVGKVRHINEDAVYFLQYDDTKAYVIVADGMGGHKGGKLASQGSIDRIRGYFAGRAVQLAACNEIPGILKECLDYVNESLYLKSLEDATLVGMGTTVVLCVITENTVSVANVGDSRLYRLHNGSIQQITKDHSLVQQLLDAGSITPEEAQHHNNKNVITRAIGSEMTVDVDTYTITVQKDDLIILCSDGLTNLVSDTEIAEVLQQEAALQDGVDKLVELANSYGGFDNITVAAIRV